MKLFVIVLILIVSFLGESKSEAQQIACEIIENGGWTAQGLGWVKTCWMSKTERIDKQDVKISSERDELVQALQFHDSKSIFYLPINVDEKFPNLVVYYAGSCSIKKISKQNFIGLSSLKVLILEQNQIEQIPSETFNDLISLERLWLSKKLKKIKIFTIKTFDFSDSNKIECFKASII
jgi:Leucine-rich repeat (LRR) protein